MGAARAQHDVRARAVSMRAVTSPSPLLVGDCNDFDVDSRVIVFSLFRGRRTFAALATGQLQNVLGIAPTLNLYFGRFFFDFLDVFRALERFA